MCTFSKSCDYDDNNIDSAGFLYYYFSQNSIVVDFVVDDNFNNRLLVRKHKCRGR